MNKIKENKEIVLAIILLVLLLSVLDPAHWFMPSMLEMIILIILVLVFSVFASFIWREHKGDERDLLHRLLAGHLAFLFGMGVLLLGIVIQSVQHNLDQWLVVTLGIMILAKIFGLIYGQRKF